MLAVADGAVLLELPNAEALHLAAALRAGSPAGFLDAVPGARTLLLLFEPERFDLASLRAGGAAVPARLSEPRTVVLHTLYDGPDLTPLSDETGLAVSDLVRLHTAAVHTVAFLGFAPGFGYLSGAPPELAVPRLRTPRVRVPAGSVAVADGYSGVYPAQTPGGWRLLGRVAERMFDPDAPEPSLLRPGDRVRFEAVDALAPPMSAPIKSQCPEPPALRVIAPGPFTSVQGAPRYGLSAYGVPAGGAMDLPALAEANALVGNEPGAAALEYTLAGPELEALVPVRVAFDGEVHELRAGERMRIGALREGVRGYLAVQGGLAPLAPGETTRPVSVGEELALDPREQRSHPARGSEQRSHPARGSEQRSHPARASEQRSHPLLTLRALPGPQLDCFRAPERFFASEYVLSPQSDRRGARLAGPALDLIRADIAPEGTAPGSVQVPGDGLPIVLGPDRPVTGGYPKIATVISADLPLLAQARPGTRLRFREVTLREALEARR